MKKRKWALIAKPYMYEIECNLCGGRNIEWSEYENMIWCYDCKKDVSGTENCLNGPVPITVARMFGCSPDEINLKTKRIRIPEQKKTLTIDEYNEFIKKEIGNFENKRK